MADHGEIKRVTSLGKSSDSAAVYPASYSRDLVVLERRRYAFIVL